MMLIFFFYAHIYRLFSIQVILLTERASIVINVILGPTFYASAVLLMGFEKANIRGSVYRPVIHCAYKL